MERIYGHVMLSFALFLMFGSIVASLWTSRFGDGFQSWVYMAIAYLVLALPVPTWKRR